MEQSVIHTRALAVGHKKKRVLSGIDIDLAQGDFCYLIGKTGTGKSSLLRTLYADIPVVAGEACVAGFDLARLKSREIPYLRRHLGIVFQDFQLLSDRNVHDNLEFVLRATDWKNRSAIDARIDKVLEMVGLFDKLLARPNQLSGGEQQRVAIARALLNSPQVLLADEPTGNLDPDTSDEIINLLMDISKAGCAVLVATHDFLMITNHPAHILICEDGKVRHEDL